MDPIMAQIQPFGFNFAPRGWVQCNGQLMSIASNSALFSLLGTTYGGDGVQTFGIPDLRGRTMVGAGSGPGLAPIAQGEKAGVQNVTLNAMNLPSHTHPATATSTLNGQRTTGNSANPNANSLASLTNLYVDTTTATVPLAAGSVATTVTVGPSGNNAPFSVLNPYLGLNICIATAGVYPSRN